MTVGTPLFSLPCNSIFSCSSLHLKPSSTLYSLVAYSPLKHPTWLLFIWFASLHLRPIFSLSLFDSFCSSPHTFILFCCYWTMNPVKPLDFFASLCALFLYFHSTSLPSLLHKVFESSLPFPQQPLTTSTQFLCHKTLTNRSFSTMWIWKHTTVWKLPSVWTPFTQVGAQLSPNCQFGNTYSLKGHMFAPAHCSFSLFSLGPKDSSSRHKSSESNWFLSQLFFPQVFFFHRLSLLFFSFTILCTY